MADGVAVFEVERRFLVKDAAVVAGHIGNPIVQGYLFSVDGYVVRVRRTHLANEDKTYREGPAFATLKGPRARGAREEYEVAIPSAFATEMLRRTSTKVSKTRYQIIDSGQAWDVDVFHGDNEGLIVAECEGSDVSTISVPQWCGAEITDDPRYNNENLAHRPFSRW